MKNVFTLVLILGFSYLGPTQAMVPPPALEESALSYHCVFQVRQEVRPQKTPLSPLSAIEFDLKTSVYRVFEDFDPSQWTHGYTDQSDLGAKPHFVSRDGKGEALSDGFSPRTLQMFSDYDKEKKEPWF